MNFDCYLVQKCKRRNDNFFAIAVSCKNNDYTYFAFKDTIDNKIECNVDANE